MRGEQMNEIKYRDKGYLNSYDLDVELFSRFNLIVNDVIPVRKVFILCTEQGNKVLKRIDYPIKNLQFVHSVIKYLEKNNFNRTINFLETVDGKIYTEWNKEIYIIMDLVEGRECEYSNPVDVIIASKALGEFHKASIGFKSNLEEKNNCHKLINEFKNRLEKIKFYKNVVISYKNKSEFDNIFLENVDYHIEQIVNSIKILEDSDYNNLCDEYDKIVLCHHDLAHHNILIQGDEAYFIDFDYALIDLKVHDLCNYINKVIKNFAFDMDKAESIIDSYCVFNSLDRRELKVLYGMLSFPEDFYGIIRDYYGKYKNWGEELFLRRLIKKVEYKYDREEFLENFNKYIK